MRIEFDKDGNVIYDVQGNANFIEISKTDEGVAIILSSRDPNNPTKRVVNSVGLSIDDFRKLISDI